MENKVRIILAKVSDEDLSDLIVNTYKEVEKNYFLQSWKTSELDAGHFVEAARRFLEHVLFGKYTRIGKSLSAFNDKAIQSYLHASGDEAYRIHIPRVLFSIYGIRNKRGVGHLSNVSPNRSDATFIMSSVKWVLAELIRINSIYSADETVKLVDHIIDRPVEGIWEEGEIIRILADGLNLKEKIIFLLFVTKLSNSDEIFGVVENGNKVYFKKVLRELHDSRFIELMKDGNCVISPKGKSFAESIVLSKIHL